MKRRVLPLLAAGMLLALAGCASGGVGTTPDATGAPTLPAETPTVTSAPTASADPESTEDPPAAGDIALPASCEQVWTERGLGILSEEVAPLNDESLTMLSTEVVPALEVLDVAPSIRCTWGAASEVGTATTVAIVDAAQAETVRTALRDAGFACEDRDVVTRCDREQTLEGETTASSGEVHVLGGNGWVATHWLNTNLEPDYTEDIIASLWG
ncbi:hypothetical protein N8K70_11795 [Microbacterium betulae]|uniref:DUF3558 domain-containing protein n=1 Tax=Microbacterium betulae TaxID=2981139 RepID=A0AA97FH98_9MICO|nr:hypothetical protein [Microbacterium sp. AB]WOF22059.1 hypothetical protein N8K70_11795 [Microbacterium sp. AB]